MTTPTVLANGYSDAEVDVNLAPSGQGDGPRVVVRTAVVADNATAGTTYGLVPFQKGASVDYGAKLITSDLDTATNVTWNFGYTYLDNDTTTNINDTDAFISAQSGQTAGVLGFDEVAGATWVATAPGWLTATLAAGPVTTAGTVTFNGTITYQV
jgi:hypothetical protein